MQLSPQSLKILAGVVTGDGHGGIYRRRVDLEEFFHGLGFTSENEDALSRHLYTLNKLVEANGTAKLVAAVKATLDPRHFVDREHLLTTAIEELNKHIRFDGYEVVLKGQACHVRSLRASTVVARNVDHLSDEFVREQLEKCEDKVASGDFDGAISSARSLIEGVLSRLHEELTGAKMEESGDLQKDFKKVRDLLQMAPEKYTEESIRQVLNGFSSVIHGIDSLSNKIGDRHKRRLKPAARHAKLVTNAAKTVVDFLIESYRAQCESKEPI